MDTTHICERCETILYDDDGVIRLRQTNDKCIETWFCEACWVIIKEMKEEQTCGECGRTETECQAQATHETNPITKWVGYKDPMCDDCYYDRYASSEEDDYDDDYEKTQHKKEFPDHEYCDDCDCCKGCECCECGVKQL